MPVPGIDYGVPLVQLPPVRSADAGFSRLVDETGEPIDAAWKQRRAAALLDLARSVRPDILLIETFPFGRRPFRFELEPLLQSAAAARPRPVIACSVRDILVEKGDPAKVLEMAATARTFFDRVLVHGDPAVIPFGATFPEARSIADRIRYTGYVAPSRPLGRPAADRPGQAEVVVSVGGGAVGLPLLRAALAARALTPLAAAPWRLLAGPDVPDGAFEALVRAAPAGVVVERARPDFPDLLSRCALSVSQAGYNTVMDLLQARCRAVVVPFAAGNETEQTTRAVLLAERGLLTLVPEPGLTPESLAAGIAAALAAPPPPAFSPALDGAAATARLLAEALERRTG
jgi:predicted glycosyltransferase